MGIRIAVQYALYTSEIFCVQIKVITIAFSEHMSYSYWEAQSVTVYSKQVV